MLATRLSEMTPPHDMANIVGAAVHPADVREVRGHSGADDDVVAWLVHHGTTGELPQAREATRDAVGDVALRLARSAVAFALAGNIQLASDQWHLAGRLVGIITLSGTDATPSAPPRYVPTQADRDAADSRLIVEMFVKIGLTCTVDVDRVANTLYPIVDPADSINAHETIVAIAREVRATLPRDTILRTRGLRTLTLNLAENSDDGEDLIRFQFSVRGETRP